LTATDTQDPAQPEPKNAALLSAMSVSDTAADP